MLSVDLFYKKRLVYDKNNNESCRGNFKRNV